VVNQQTKHKAVLTFKQNDLMGKDLHKVEGFIYDPKSVILSLHNINVVLIIILLIRVILNMCFI